MRDLWKILQILERKGAFFRAINQEGVDTSTKEGRFFTTMLGAVAEFEGDLSAERQREGIERAKEKGKYKGRKRQYDREEIKALHQQGLSAQQISLQVGCGIATAYRIIGE